MDKRLREGRGEFGFAYAVGTEENEQADGTLGIFEAGTRSDDGASDDLHGFVSVSEKVPKLLLP